VSVPQQSSFGCAAHVKPCEVDGATIFCTRQQKTLREYLYLDREQAYNATSPDGAGLAPGERYHLARRPDVSTTDDEQSYVIAVNKPADQAAGVIVPAPAS
jgi:hypothetical protein